MYGDIYVNNSDHGLDVTIELADGKFAKVYTDNAETGAVHGFGQAGFTEDALAPKHSGAKLIWSRANA